MKTTSPLKRFAAAVTLLGTAVAAFSMDLGAQAGDLVASATVKVDQWAAGSETTHAVVMPIAAIALMALIAKRRGRRD